MPSSRKVVIAFAALTLGTTTVTACSSSSGGNGFPAPDSGNGSVTHDSGALDTGTTSLADSAAQDTTVTGTDAEIPPSDTGMLPGETGATTGDTGAQTGDTGASTSDTGEVQTDAGMDAGAPVGTALALGAGFAVEGVTGDGFAIYTDGTQSNLYAVSIGEGADGGATGDAGGPKVIVAAPSTLTISGNVVLVWTNLDPTTNAGTLTAWTSAGGAKTISTASNPLVNAQNAPAFGSVSADSSLITYLDNANASTADVYVAAPDGTHAHKLITAINLAAGGCAPTGAFAGSYVVVDDCPDSTLDGGVGPTIETYAGPTTWTKATIVANAGATWSTDTAPTVILVTDPSGAQVFPITGGIGKTIDAAGTLGQVTKDGMNVVYTTAALDADGGVSGNVKRSPVATPAPANLATGGIGFLLEPLAQQTMLYYKNQDPNTGLIDLYLASAVIASAGGGVTLSSAATADVFGDFFTADGTHALYYTDVDPTTLVGPLNAIAVGGTPTVLGQNVFLDFATTAGAIVFNDNYDANNNVADIKWVDTAAAAAATPIVAQADVFFFVTAAKNKVVYTWQNVMPGVYVANIP